MEYLVGYALAVAVSAAASRIGLDKERSFYPTVLMVIASYYALFAIVSGSVLVLLHETAPIAVFTGIAIVGFKRNPWFLAAGLFAHSVFDLTHGHFIDNSGVPTWWPGFCLTYDATAALYLASRIVQVKRP